MADKNAKTRLIGIKFGIRGFLGSLITNLSVEFKNSTWRIQNSRLKCKKLFDWDEIWYSGVFGIANYESERKIQKFKIADPKWRTKMQKLT